MPVQRSEIFALNMRQDSRDEKRDQSPGESDNPDISSNEVDMWLKFFDSGSDEPDNG